MSRLLEMQTFVRIVEAGSISAAAEQLDQAKSGVSRRLSDLEGRLGVRLINRTTRRSSLTDAGRRYYEGAVKLLSDVKAIKHDSKFAVDVAGMSRKMVLETFDPDNIDQSKISPTQFAELVKLVDGGTLNKCTPTEVLTEMWEPGADPQKIVDEKGLAQVSDTSAIETIVDEVLGRNDKMVQDYLGGKDKLFGALMGQCMGALKGKGNPQVVKETLQAKLDAMK